MKPFTKLTLTLTIIWLIILAYFSFFTEVSSNLKIMIYFIGQSFLTALILPKLVKKRKCKTQELK